MTHIDSAQNWSGSQYSKAGRTNGDVLQIQNELWRQDASDITAHSWRLAMRRRLMLGMFGVIANINNHYLFNICRS